MEDNYLHKGKRERLVRILKQKGITDQHVLNAIETIPRHFFVDKIFEHHAYEDKPFSIGEGQTISQPYTVAYQTQLLQLKASDVVLEIGTGSGYQASILYHISKNIYSIERQKLLYNKTKKLLLEKLNYKIKLFFGDGTSGLKKEAPFDKIIVTAAAPELPKNLLKQLKNEGLLVIPIGNEKKQIMHRIKKISENEFENETFSEFSFVPLIGEDGW